MISLYTNLGIGISKDCYWVTLIANVGGEG